jgi:DNA-binding XRE family transcriptional regulator
MTMRRVSRNRRLSAEEVEKYRKIRKDIAQELPELVARHQERMVAREQLDQVFEQLKCAREDKGLSLADVTRLSGMDRSALSKLETGQRPNPTIETLMRYAEAVGKRLVLTLADA